MVELTEFSLTQIVEKIDNLITKKIENFVPQFICMFTIIIILKK